MSIAFTTKNKYLSVNNKTLEFFHSIKDAQLLNDQILVLLEIPKNDDTIDNLYSVDSSGKIIWQSQSLKEIYSTERLLPYEQIVIVDNEIRATDFYGRRYYINSRNGKIINRDIMR